MTDKEKQYLDNQANEVIREGNPYRIVKFAFDVPNAPIDKLANAILNSGNNEFVIFFAHLIKNSPLDKFADYFIKNKAWNYVIELAKIDGAPIDKLADAMIDNCESIAYNGKIEYFYKFANEVKGAPVERLAEINAIYDKQKMFTEKFEKLLNELQEEPENQ